MYKYYKGNLSYKDLPKDIRDFYMEVFEWDIKEYKDYTNDLYKYDVYERTEKLYGGLTLEEVIELLRSFKIEYERDED